MTTYIKASDSILTVVDKNGKEHEVTRRAYDVVYKAKGYRPVNAQEELNELENEPVDFYTLSREELKKNTNDDLKAFLDKEGIEYDSKAVKEDLVNLILGE